MLGLPLELVTMLGSTVLGGVMSIWGQSIKARQAEQKMLMERANFNAKQAVLAREAGKNDKHFAWTRRLIALSSVFAIIVLPKLVAVFYPEVDVIVGYTEIQTGFLDFIFGPGQEVVKWKYAQGFVITPLDTHIVSAIVGLYFGAGFAKQDTTMPIAGPFDRPIPGESLTGERGNNPWEQPAQMSDVKEVATFYLNKLNNDEIIDDFTAMVQAGVPLAPIVETTYLQGVMRGLHSLDAGLVVAPVIHAFLKQSIEAMGVSVKDTSEDPQKKAEQAEMQRFLLLANKYLDEEATDEPDAGKDMLQDMVDTQEGEPAEEMVQEEKPQGLMAKG